MRLHPQTDGRPLAGDVKSIPLRVSSHHTGIETRNRETALLGAGIAVVNFLEHAGYQLVGWALMGFGLFLLGEGLVTYRKIGRLIREGDADLEKLYAEA